MQSSIPQAIMMIRPAAFGYNPETASSNAFQQPIVNQNLQSAALIEFDEMVETLRAHDITVHVFEDSVSPIKPDAVFPNNWISFHPDGKVITYPMMASSRRAERRMDIIEYLNNKYAIHEVIDLSAFESSNIFLEGTGSVIFDHANHIMYASRSDRTHEIAFRRLADLTSYKSILFDAVDENNHSIYHTNVIMTLGSNFAILCLDAIKKVEDQELLLDSLAHTGHKVIAISYEQMHVFAGNMFEVLNSSGQPYILMSDQAYRALIPGQLNALSLNHEILSFKIPVIEGAGGGSVRCMLAGIHLPV
jgi:hypothetical protein